MYSNEDFERLFIRYKGEAYGRGESIQAKTVRREVRQAEEQEGVFLILVSFSLQVYSIGLRGTKERIYFQMRKKVWHRYKHSYTPFWTCGKNCLILRSQSL